MKILSNAFWFLALFWVLQNVTYLLTQPGRNRDFAMVRYKDSLRGSMLRRQAGAPLLDVPGGRAQDVSVNTDFRYVLLKHPKLSAQTSWRDFRAAFARNARRKKEMQALGFEGMIYSDGTREWMYGFGWPRRSGLQVLATRSRSRSRQAA